MPWFVVTGLVGQDHAALERRHAELRNARGPFMHREIAADPMTSAVIEVEPRRP